LEDGLQWWKVDEEELDDERYGYCQDQHPILR
jgi:hypothetical protein